MITCTLNDKKYTVDFITGRALREMEPAAKMYSRIVALSNAALKGETPEEAKELSIGEAMDVMIRWFCILFGNQFTPDDVLGPLPGGPAHARHRAGAHGGADADHGDTRRIPYEGSEDGAPDGDRLTLPDFIYSTYNSLLEGGWRMDEIDRMDLPGFLRIRAWNARQEQKKKAPRRRYIDEVWPGLKP